jgi:general secretion pathway protein N
MARRARPRGADWDRQRRAAVRLGAAGALAGAVAALIGFAPAAWLAAAVAGATDDRLLLADARGSVWAGSAVPVLTGGPGSRDASALPGRLTWSLALDGLGLALRARQACCIPGELRLRIEPGIGRVVVRLPASGGALAQWPASWLAGLGTPFNTLQFTGTMTLSSGGLVAERAAGRWRLAGEATLVFESLSSRLSPLPVLGTYRLALSGGDVARIVLATQDGPLRLSGNGEWAASGLRFRGQAQAAPGSEAALGNLLNLIGRRQGTLSVLSIG